MITNYHAKYYAHELTAKHSSTSVDRISRSLFDASVDLNPHQIEASLFALRSPLSKGVVLADEVGLGKTIEAALVLCQLWAERKRNLLIICPASLRKQWATELQDKFNLPTQILDTTTFKKVQKQGVYNPLLSGKITIVSYHFPLRLEESFIAVPWDLVVIDEAHKLRNAHRQSNKIGQTLKRIFDGRNKLLLTATPLQNSLIELYGLSTLIDEHLFGDDKSFRKQFMLGDSSMTELRERLSHFVKRTLRRNVLEYIRYTERKAITVPFMPTDKEQGLYEAISEFLANEDTFALPKRHRHLSLKVGLCLKMRNMPSNWISRLHPPFLQVNTSSLKNTVLPLLKTHTPIMHAKADRVSSFLQNDLLKIIREAFGEADGKRVEEARLAYEDAIKKAKEYGAANPEETEPVKKAKAAYDALKDAGNGEGEIYDHLFRFFERYYDNGDFMSRRYYARETDGKAAPYSVPYDGREVYLHWANRDQYYIKTSEYLTNFTFNLANAPELKGLFEQENRKVHCRIIEAAEGEHGNVKTTDRTERYFLIHKDEPVKIENGDLVIQFEYRPGPEKSGQGGKWQEKRIEEAEKAIQEALKSVADAKIFIAPLSTLIGQDKDRTLLRRYPPNAS